MGNNLFEDMLHEKSMDYEKLTAVKPISNAQKSVSQVMDGVILSNGKRFKNSKLSADDLDSFDDAEIKARIDSLMGLALNPDSESKVTMDEQQVVLSDMKKKVNRKRKEI